MQQTYKIDMMGCHYFEKSQMRSNNDDSVDLHNIYNL